MKSVAEKARKQCVGICGRTLELSAFTRNSARVDGREIYCRSCSRIRSLLSTRLTDEPELAPPDESRAMTWPEIAKELGVTPQAVQQIEARALRKLRNNRSTMARIRRLLEE